MGLELYMVGVIVEDMARAAEFYRRLGVDVPEGAESEGHVEIKMSGLTFFLSTKEANARWDPARRETSGDGYRIVLEFYLEGPPRSTPRRGADRLRLCRPLRAVRRHPEHALRDGRRPRRQHDPPVGVRLAANNPPSPSRFGRRPHEVEIRLERVTLRSMAFCPNCGQSVPADARFCPSCANPIFEPAQPSEERKLATVLFADLVGSTELADSQDPERTRALLNRFYDAMAAEIADAGGTVEKFVGDAVMAAFGAPAAQEDHAERALHAALSMQRRLEELFGDALSLRIGVNTGDVVVGQPRVGSSFVTGDAVNVAARLEQAAEPGEILVGERTAAAVRGAFELDEPATVAAKGKAGGVACRRLVRALSLMRPRGVGGLRHAFVGRERELEALQQAYGRTVARGSRAS